MECGGYLKRGVLLGVALAIVVGCTTQSASASQVTPLGLWSEPESHLVSANSAILETREGQPHQTVEGWDSAFVRSLVGSQDAAAEIESFYEIELASRGWQPPTDNQAAALGIRTSSELSAQTWRKGDLVFRLGIVNMSDPYAEGPSAGYVTVYRISLVDRPAKPSPS
jgi:hypothetical protein